MENDYWTMIRFLLECVRAGTVNGDKLRETRLSLSKSLDKRAVVNLPTEETERLLRALDGLDELTSARV